MVVHHRTARPVQQGRARIAPVAEGLRRQARLIQQLEALQSPLLIPLAIAQAEGDYGPLGARTAAFRVRRALRPGESLGPRS